MVPDETRTDAVFKKLVVSMPPVEDDDFPSSEHQGADRFGRAVLGTSDSRLSRQRSVAGNHIVLPKVSSDRLGGYRRGLYTHTNRRSLWGDTAAQARDPISTQLMSEFNNYYTSVIRMRGRPEKDEGYPHSERRRMEDPPNRQSLAT